MSHARARIYTQIHNSSIAWKAITLGVFESYKCQVDFSLFSCTYDSFHSILINTFY